jgi:geranylgeranyl pyrophosphate synthase
VTSLESYLTVRRATITDALGRYLSPGSTAPPVLIDAMRYSVDAGGKRVRPLLTVATAEAVGGEQAVALALPAACAVEMIHTYSLIHDDLPAMDDDSLRRGQPTLHIVAGEAMAILAGDGLQAEAFALLARAPEANDAEVCRRKMRVVAVLAGAAGVSGMVGGQAIDIDAVRPGPGRTLVPMSAADLQAMHSLKTGALIRAAAVAGAVMGGADERTITLIDVYATEVGLAFQIVDDILDVEAASSMLGKTAGKDARAGKPTYPSLFGVERSRALAAECLSRAEAHLESAGLHDSHLRGIAHWIVNRVT